MFGIVWDYAICFFHLKSLDVSNLTFPQKYKRVIYLCNRTALLENILSVF